MNYFWLKNGEYFNKIHKISLLRGSSHILVTRQKLKEIRLQRSPHLASEMYNFVLAPVWFQCICRVEVFFLIDHRYIYLALLVPSSQRRNGGEGSNDEAMLQSRSGRVVACLFYG